MYRSIYYDRKEYKIHLWDDVSGYTSFPFKSYHYQKDPYGEYKSIYGDSLKRVNGKSKSNSDDIFENDVDPIVRTLIDKYLHEDEPSTGHKICFYDIEVEMVTGRPNPAEGNCGITSIAVSNGTDFLVFVHGKERAVKYTKQAKVLIFDSEKELLEQYLKWFRSEEFTIITGWNSDAFDNPYLYNRIKRILGKGKADSLSPISKVNVRQTDKGTTYIDIAGISCLDYMVLYQNFTYTDEPSYSLDHISFKELKKHKIEYDGSLDDLYRDDLDKFIEYNIVDVELVQELDKKLQFIDLTLNISHVCHSPYEYIYQSSRHLEAALLTFMKRKGLVATNKPEKVELYTNKAHILGERQLTVNCNIPARVPKFGTLGIKISDSVKVEVEYHKYDGNTFYLSKPIDKYIPKDRKAAPSFEGAFVKDPIPGLYKWLYDIDLESLYPSIIRSLNISPETKIGVIQNWEWDDLMNPKSNKLYNIPVLGMTGISISELKELFFDSGKYSVATNGAIYNVEKQGIIPEVLTEWFMLRKQYKNKMVEHGNRGEHDLETFYDKRQLVQKILLNSMYGVLGLSSFRFNDYDNAKAVTTVGQTVIKSSAKLANMYYKKELGKEDDYVIYIDTDSLFLSAVPLVKHRKPHIDITDKDAMVPEILSVAKEVEGFINKMYSPLSQSIFNISTHYFNIKQEVISTRGIWLAKKRYAQWLINEKGVFKEKLEVKGLDTVRSSFPNAFKSVMTDVLLMILKEEQDEDHVTDKIKEFYKSLQSISPKEVAKVSRVKELTKFESKINTTSIGNFDKGVPAHVKAALVYNQLLDHYQCEFKYEPISNYQKTKWIYLQKNPLGLESIALKGDKDPEKIMKFIEQFVDKKKMFDSELKQKLEDFYNALQWEFNKVFLKKAVNVNNFF